MIQRCGHPTLVLTLLLGPFWLGCENQPTFQPITPSTIPLKVWVTLCTDEPIGRPANYGCRLSESDMRAFIGHLQQNAIRGLYGASTRFSWDQVIERIDEDTQCGRRYITLRDFYIWSNMWNWRAHHLNIYFTGNVEGDVYSGFNQDPHDTYFGGRIDTPFILINDGWLEYQQRFTPEQLRTANLLEHEIAHYLARFECREFTVPPQSRYYDEHEHVPDRTDNILCPFFYLDRPYPLLIPGTENRPQSELGQMWTRVRDRQWNYP